MTDAADIGSFDLAGRVALVTGASRGIGGAIADALAAAGAHLVLNGRQADALAARVSGIEDRGGSAEAMAFDVNDAEAATAAVADIGRHHGRLDILVSNVGGGVRKALPDHSDAEFLGALQSNVVAGFRLAREAARLMVPRKWGRIVLTSSVNGTVVRPTMSGYAAAKAAVNGLVRALAVELAPSGICVNALAPGYFPTEGNSTTRRDNPALVARVKDRTPMGRWGDLSEIGPPALFLCSPAASYCTGQVLHVDGGLTVSL